MQLQSFFFAVTKTGFHRLTADALANYCPKGAHASFNLYPSTFSNTFYCAGPLQFGSAARKFKSCSLMEIYTQ
jgi:hypothetical protein